MSDFGYIIGQLKSEMEYLTAEVSRLANEIDHLKQLRNSDLETVVKEQGVAIRDMTLVLERVVDVVIPVVNATASVVVPPKNPTDRYSD